MTINDKYNKRVELCRELRDIEDEIEKITDISNRYKESSGNKKMTLSIYIEGETTQYHLDEKTANGCIEFISAYYGIQKDNIVRFLIRELE